jgi:S-adenosylmethionine synthetase
VQVAYSIGVADPLSIIVNTYGTGKLADAQLLEVISKTFNFKPAAMISYLNMLRPIYKKTAAYGHFGRPDPDFAWEQTNRADLLKEKAGL